VTSRARLAEGPPFQHAARQQAARQQAARQQAAQWNIGPHITGPMFHRAGSLIQSDGTEVT
jgi:hypothetical protein